MELSDSKVTFKCNKCGKIIEYELNDKWAFAHKNECHTIDLGVMGYGSKLDGDHVKFNLCDDCLFDLINSFEHNDFASIN